jgi:hypothetical protein
MMAEQLSQYQRKRRCEREWIVEGWKRGKMWGRREWRV